jgi:hypothetical protein
MVNLNNLKFIKKNPTIELKLSLDWKLILKLIKLIKANKRIEGYQVFHISDWCILYDN